MKFNLVLSLGALLITDLEAQGNAAAVDLVRAAMALTNNTEQAA